MPRRPQDSALFVKFTRRSVLNQAKSWGEKILDNENKVIEDIKGAGHPVHENIDYVEITIPGDRDNINLRPVMVCDKQFLEPGARITPQMACRARVGADDKPMLEECDPHRFPEEFAAFKSGQEKQTEGIDLKAWPGIDPASVDDLSYFKVHTVEQLAAMNDSNVGQFHCLRERAREYLESAKKSATRADVEAKDAQLKAMQEQINQLLAAQKAPAKPSKAAGA
jgi:hypothetical protein